MKSARANQYQWIYNEVPVDYDFLKSFYDDEGLFHDQHNKEQIYELKDELFILVMNLAKEQLTDKQFTVLSLYPYHTQEEIAKKIGSTQPSVVRTINMNSNPKIDGGAIPKMKRLVLKDKKIQQILSKIRELKE